MTPRLETIARFDYLNNGKNGGGLLGYGVDDRNGIGPNGGSASRACAGDPVQRRRQPLCAVLGMNYLFNQNTIFKAEDRSTAPTSRCS